MRSACPPPVLEPTLRQGHRWLCALLASACALPMAQAQPWRHDGHPGHGVPRGHARMDHRGEHRPAHGAHHAYPRTGTVVQVLPAPAPRVVWHGVPYRFHDGVWYSPAGRGHAVVRPPRGVWVSSLPVWRTVVVVGGLSYLVLNGIYYRERASGGYEVVDAPAASNADALAAASAAERVFVYPRNGQSAQQQAADAQDCHRWAVAQTGMDPGASAAGVPQVADAQQRGDYQRARGACLDGRGYTVR